MKQIYSNTKTRTFNQQRTDNGPIMAGLKSRITSIIPGIYHVIAPMLFVAFGLFGVNESAWGENCNYSVSNFVSSKNTEKNGDTYLLGRKNYYDVPTFEFGNVTNNYGISHVKLSLKFGGLNAVTEKFQLQYKVGSGSWTNIGSQVTASVISTDIDQDVSIAGAAEQKVYFRLNRVEKAKFTDTQTLTLSGFEVRMKSTVSPSVSSIDFRDVIYGNNKSETVTAYYTLNYSGNMSVSCTGDYSASISAGCNCSTSQQSKTITVTFTPTQAGTRNGTLTISNPDGTNTTVSLSGTGVRANPTLKMNNGSVNVTTDKANPIELDLAGLKASGTTTGIGAFDSFVLQSADASTGAKAEGVTIDGSTFSSTVGGTYTVRATTAQNNQYNSTYKDFTVTVNRKEQTISWNTEESVFVEEDVISATSIGDVTLTKSGTGAEYVSIDGNTATIGEVGANTTVTLTATAAQTDVYAEATDSKTISLTSLIKQHITFTMNLTKLKTTDGTKKVELVATSDSGRDSYITFAVDANTAGVSVTHEGDKWYLNYTAKAVKGIAVTASLAGVEGVSIAASDVSRMVKVTDPTAKCDITETLETAYGIKSTDKVYDLTIPKEVVLNVRCSEKSLNLLYGGYEIKFYNAKNQQVGSTQSFGFTDGHYYTKDVKTRTFSNLDKNITKMVFTSNASKGYDITEASYEHHSYANPSVSELNYEAYALSTVEDQTFTLDYANYQIELSIEGSSNFVIKSEDSFGDCETYGSKTVKVGYNVPAVKCEETAYLYIRDNTGAELGKITLHANVLGGLTQNVKLLNVKNSYLTTDSAHLSATSDRGLTNFTYSASPKEVASVDGNVLTFSKSGTATVTVTEAGNATFNDATASMENITINKATPAIVSLPTGTAIAYRSTLNSSTLSGGSADVTLRGVEHSTVSGSFAWTEPTHVVTDAQGSHSYAVTFNPTDGGMYNPNTTGSISIDITRAEQSLVMNNGTVKVAVDGIDAGAADSKIDLDDAGVVTFEVISTNKSNATIGEGNIFSATVCGTYTVRATKAQTEYYNRVTADFTVTVSKRANTLATTAAYTKYVDEDITTVATKINSDGTIHTSSSAATIAHYDVSKNKIVIDNSSKNKFDQTNVTIKIWQDATDCFEGITEANAKTITVTVKKYDNAITCDWTNWTKELNFDQSADITFSANNKETKLEVKQVKGDSIAAYETKQNATYDEKGTVQTSHLIGIAQWSVEQEENYKYKAPQKQYFTLDVKTLAKPADCLVLDDKGEYSLYTIETGPSFTLSAPGDSLYFEGYRSAAAVNDFFVQYSTTAEGDNFADIEEVQLEAGANVVINDPYKSCGPIDLPDGTVRIRFRTTTGATLHKYYRNIRVTRKTSLLIEDKNDNPIDTLQIPLNVVGGNSSSAKFYLDYNVCDDYIKVESNHPHISVREEDKAFAVDANGEGHREIELIYASVTAENITTTVTVYTKYTNRTLVVTARTDKQNQTLTWANGFETEPVNLPVGYNTGTAAAASSEMPIKYAVLTEAEKSVISISEDRYSFSVIGTGTAHLIATQEGNALWYSVSDTVLVNGTDSHIQLIKWSQDLTHTLTLNDTVRLTAEVFILNNAGQYVKSDERTAVLHYTDLGNGIVEILGDTALHVLNYGPTSITASLAHDDDYEDAAPVILPVNVRGQSEECQQALLVNKIDTIVFEPSVDWGFSGGEVTPPITGEAITIDLSQGTPDKLKFHHSGKEYKIVGKVGDWYRGEIAAQQRVRGTWSEITGSRIAPTKNVWDSLENIQLDEHADAIRFVRDAGAYGYHYMTNIQITMLPYLRTDNHTVDFGNIQQGAVVDTVLTIEYANLKSSVSAKKGKDESIFTLGADKIYPDCGTQAEYGWPVRFAPTLVNPNWMDSVTFTDDATGDSIVIYVKANVTAGAMFVFEDKGDWGTAGNWNKDVLPTANDHVIIANDVTIPEGVDVTVKTLAINEGVTVTVNGTLTIKESTPEKDVYGDLYVAEGGSLDLTNISAGALKVHDFVIASTPGTPDGTSSSGQVEDPSKLNINGDVYIDITLAPAEGFDDGIWYGFTLPFDVDAKTGIYRYHNGMVEKASLHRDYETAEFSPETYMTGGHAWRYYNGTLKAGVFYFITVDGTDNVYRFKKKDGAALQGETSVNLTPYGDPDDAYANWNPVGNSMLSYASAEFAGQYVQVYKNGESSYLTVPTSSASFVVGCPFFIQTTTADVLNLSSATLTKSAKYYAPSRSATSDATAYQVQIAADGQSFSDQIFVSASEDAENIYEMGRDLLKAGVGTKSAQLWVNAYDKKLSVNEAVLDENQATFDLTLYAPKAGEYTISVAQEAEGDLYLTYNGNVFWNLSLDPYTAVLNKGNNTEYGLLLIPAERHITTEVEQASDNQQPQKFIKDGKLFILNNGALYESTGKKVQ